MANVVDANTHIAVTNKSLRQPGRFERATLWLAILFLTIFLINGNWLWRLDQLLYDETLQFWKRPAPTDIIIIAVDETSLEGLGRWPWSRGIHAELIDTLTKEKAAAIGLDIILSEPANIDPKGDQQLAKAISRNGRIVLPLLVEQSRIGGQLIETLPIPIFSNAAAALAHVHVELDLDGIARSVFLREGLGTPHWPNLGLAMLKIADPDYSDTHLGTRNPEKPSHSSLVWVRNQKILIPYAGPPGHFQTISYAQVLEGRFLPGTFTDKLVLIGATATGLGDALPTPVSGHNHSMPGVEINANIIDTLRNNLNITPLKIYSNMLLSGLIVLLPAFLFSHMTPRWNLITTILLITSTILASMLLLRVFHIWYAPSAALLALIITYPLWSWRRLENAMRFLNQELAILNSEQANIPKSIDLNLIDSLHFLQKMLPISGWSLFAENGELKLSEDDAPKIIPAFDIIKDKWNSYHSGMWLDMSTGKGPGILGIHWTHSEPPNNEQQALLDDLLYRYQSEIKTVPRGSVEVLGARIEEVQTATDSLRGLRQFISDSISQMGDGILVVDPLGHILLSNDRAAMYLDVNQDGTLNGRSLPDMLNVLKIQGTVSWASLLREVLLEHNNVQIEARHTNGRDLLIQIAPLDRSNRELGGFIVNLSDITPLKTSERERAELLGFLSHDLRSPIVSLMALLEISRAKDSDQKLRELINRMEGYAQNTLDLAEEFLQLAHAESGENIHFSEVDLVSISLNAIENVWAQANQKHILLEHNFIVDDAWIRADANLIERALTNLLNNAIKYSPDNTKVTIILSMIDNEYYCCISDQGHGIPQDEIPKLFDRFYRVQQSSSQKINGIGLGLAFVKAVATRHDGRISVKSEINNGSEFCLILPVIYD